MNISDNIIKEQLKNVYFLCGGAFGGKTTMSKLIEKKYGFLRYRQGDHFDEFATIATPEFQPVISMDRSKVSWHKYFSQSPKEYAEWLDAEMEEEAEFAIMDLIKISQSQKVIADVSIPVNILKRIADKYKQWFLLC